MPRATFPVIFDKEIIRTKIMKRTCFIKVSKSKPTVQFATISTQGRGSQVRPPVASKYRRKRTFFTFSLHLRAQQ